MKPFLIIILAIMFYSKYFLKLQLIQAHLTLFCFADSGLFTS